MGDSIYDPEEACGTRETHLPRRSVFPTPAGNVSPLKVNCFCNSKADKQRPRHGARPAGRCFVSVAALFYFMDSAACRIEASESVPSIYVLLTSVHQKQKNLSNNLSALFAMICLYSKPNLASQSCEKERERERE